MTLTALAKYLILGNSFSPTEFLAAYISLIANKAQSLYLVKSPGEVLLLVMYLSSLSTELYLII
jgi:hypothetical protein